MTSVTGMKTAEQILTNPTTRRVAAARWWRTARGYFLTYVEALTREEQRAVARWPARYRPGIDVDAVKVDAELFGTLALGTAGQV